VEIINILWEKSIANFPLPESGELLS